MKQLNKTKGNINEDKAVDYIKKNTKLKILERNFSCKLGEIDIIAFDKKENSYVFVEVKYRKDSTFGLGRETVDVYKQRKIINVAQCYLNILEKRNSKLRFAVVDILGDEITFIDNAF